MGIASPFLLYTELIHLLSSYPNLTARVVKEILHMVYISVLPVSMKASAMLLHKLRLIWIQLVAEYNCQHYKHKQTGYSSTFSCMLKIMGRAGYKVKQMHYQTDNPFWMKGVGRAEQAPYYNIIIFTVLCICTPYVLCIPTLIHTHTCVTPLQTRRTDAHTM